MTDKIKTDELTASPLQSGVMAEAGFTMIELLIVIAIVGIIAFIPIGEKLECSAKTEGMGFDSKWSLFGGCRIEIEESKWIPLERYRHIEE